MFAGDEPPKPANPEPVKGPLFIRFTDDSSMKMLLRDEKIEITTSYGKLRIPFSEVREIDFGTRIPADVAKQIAKAIADLASDTPATRDSASADLLSLREKAYPALLEAAKSPDAEVKRRADELIDKLREMVPEDQLTVRKSDTIRTEDMTVIGKIEAATWKASTTQFGDVEVKLADIRSLRTSEAPPTEKVAAIPDPGSIYAFAQQVGQKLAFTVTGNVNGTVWGTDVYTADSTLAMVAVHAGVVKVGQTGTIRVEILPPQAVFVGTVRNGIQTNNYNNAIPAFKVLKDKKR